MNEPMEEVLNIMQHTSYISTGMALLLRHGVSPNKAETVLSKYLAQTMGKDGEAIASVIRSIILPTVVKATADVDQLMEELHK